MIQEKIIMGVPIIVNIRDSEAGQELFDEVFNYFTYVDEKFSTYKETSEITSINNGKIKIEESSDDMKLIFKLSEETKRVSNGYFDIVNRDGKYDPSGIVKGWSIFNAGNILRNRGVKNFMVEAGGDIEISGKNYEDKMWCVGIQNPFSKKREIIKKVYLSDKGMATSGTYVRGQHVYNPFNKNATIDDVVSLTVIGPNIYEADLIATAAFAMGSDGINFIEQLDGFDGYSIDNNGTATMTTNFNSYTQEQYA